MLAYARSRDGKAGVDEGIHIVWYDLNESEVDRYLDWLHNTHIPEVVGRPGVAWAAHYKIERDHEMMKRLIDFVGRPDDWDQIAKGWQYAFLVGATSPHVFLMPGYQDVDDADALTQEMTALRMGERAVITTEQARVNGPEFVTRAPGATPGPFIQLGHFRVRSFEEELDLSAWYANYRLPTITAMRGAIAARKLVTIAGWAKHIILYEFVSREAHEKNFMGHESLAFSDGEWTNRVVTYTHHAPGSPSIAARIWPPASDLEGQITSDRL